MSCYLSTYFFKRIHIHKRAYGYHTDIIRISIDRFLSVRKSDQIQVHHVVDLPSMPLAAGKPIAMMRGVIYVRSRSKPSS